MSPRLARNIITTDATTCAKAAFRCRSTMRPGGSGRAACASHLVWINGATADGTEKPYLRREREVRFAAKLLFMLALGLSVSGCESGPQWVGHVYPDRSNLMDARLIGYYDSLEACRAAAWDRVDTMHRRFNGDYECGYKCKPFSSGSDLLVCRANGAVRRSGT